MTRYPLNIYVTLVGGLGFVGFCILTVTASLLGLKEITQYTIPAELAFAWICLLGLVMAAMRYYTALLHHDPRDSGPGTSDTVGE